MNPNRSWNIIDSSLSQVQPTKRQDRQTKTKQTEDINILAELLKVCRTLTSFARTARTLLSTDVSPHLDSGRRRRCGNVLNTQISPFTSTLVRGGKDVFFSFLFCFLNQKLRKFKFLVKRRKVFWRIFQNLWNFHMNPVHQWSSTVTSIHATFLRLMFAHGQQICHPANKTIHKNDGQANWHTYLMC